MKKITKGLLGILGIAVFNVLINWGLASYHRGNYSSLVEREIDVRNKIIRLYSETSPDQREKEFENKVNSLIMQKEALSAQADKELKESATYRRRAFPGYNKD